MKECSFCHQKEVVEGFGYCSKCLKKALIHYRQVIHQAYHDGFPQECKVNTCTDIAKALGERQ